MGRATRASMGGPLEEARQASERLRRNLSAEAGVRTREDGPTANNTEITGIILADKQKVDRAESDEKERAAIAGAVEGSASLRTNYYCSVDETCFPKTESNMRKFPLVDHPLLK